MKRIFYILLICFLCIGCESKLSEKDEVMMHPTRINAQEFYDKGISHSVITDSAGHTLILHEVGLRGKYGYSFSVEHSPECRKCCEIYD